jgi:hypothetical protein
MVQELLGRLPHDASPRWVALAVCAAGVGLVLWAAGARFSRWLFTLVGVGAGTWVGLHAPRWFGWEIDSTGTAICGAFALGIAGYLLHGLWVAIVLAAQLAVAGGSVAWHRASLSGATWSWPKLTSPKPAMAELAASVWSAVPHVIPITMGACFVTGVVLAAVWPRMGRVLAFSMLGTLLTSGGALAAIQLVKPEWIARLPATAQAQGIAVASMVVFGAALQWALLPRNEKEKAKPAPSAGPPRPLVRDLRDLNRAPAIPPPPAARPVPAPPQLKSSCSLTAAYR